MEEREMLKRVMKYFNCSEKMASMIIQASAKNGEMNRIDKLCENDWKKEK